MSDIKLFTINGETVTQLEGHRPLGNRRSGDHAPQSGRLGESWPAMVEQYHQN